jgi:AAA domain
MTDFFIPRTYEEQVAYEEELARQNGGAAREDDPVEGSRVTRRPSSAESLGAVSRAAALERIAARSPSWRVRGILTSEDYGVLAGAKGVGKTLAQQDLAVSVALGEPWFGRFETERAIAMVLTSEDPEARLWRRFDAIARSKGRDPEELEGRLYVHPVPFNAITELSRLAVELEEKHPGLVTLDPAYKYLVGARASSLFDMGAALTPLQTTCSEAGSALLVGHHYNRRVGVGREERISGAGPLEWARVVITAEAAPRRDTESVFVTFEITGNSLDPVTFNIRRSVVALDESPNPELSYSVEVVAEGTEAVAARYATAADRVLAVLPFTADEALKVAQIGDLVASDATGKGGLKADTIRKALNRDLEGQVDSIGSHPDIRWWRS